MNNDKKSSALPEDVHVHGPGCDHDHDHAHMHESQAPYRREVPKIGRNDPCYCGSGQKFKKCHGASAAP
jgi:preprotein translocase subunit SecA